MTAADLAWVVPSVLVIIGALLKVSRQAGRIEEGVAGLYKRVDTIERHIFRFRVRGGSD